MKSTVRPCVLYAHDNREVCDLLTMKLAFSGLEVKSARTIAEAVWLARTQKIDLYLLDTRFTDDDGFELCRRMRRQDARTPILFFSGAAFEGGNEKLLGMPADAYVGGADFSALVVATVLQLIARRGETRYSRRRLRSVPPHRTNSSAVGLTKVKRRLTRSSAD